jgi:hypothetical protein
MSKKFPRVLVMVLGGFVGAYVGYWIGHLAGWSENAEWPFRIGGGDGAIGLSIGVAVVGVFLTGLILALPSAISARRISTTGHPARATVLEIWDLGLRTFGAGFGRGQFGFELSLHTDRGDRRVRGIQWLTPEELKAMVPGAEVMVRLDPHRRDRVALDLAVGPRHPALV